MPFVARLLLETTCSLVEDLAVAAPMIAALLYGTRAIDPLIFLAVPLVLLVVSFAASYIPARRAAKVLAGCGKTHGFCSKREDIMDRTAPLFPAERASGTAQRFLVCVAPFDSCGSSKRSTNN